MWARGKLKFECGSRLCGGMGRGTGWGPDICKLAPWLGPQQGPFLLSHVGMKK